MLGIENEERDFKQPQDWSLFTTRLKNNFLNMRKDGIVVSSSGSGIKEIEKSSIYTTYGLWI